MLRRNPECSHKCHESQRKISSMAGVHHLHRWKDSCLILPHKNPDCSTQPGFFIPVIPLIDESYLPLQYQRFLQWNYKIECTPISLFFFSIRKLFIFDESDFSRVCFALRYVPSLDGCRELTIAPITFLSFRYP